MPYQLCIVRAGEFIKCGPRSTLDFPETKRVLTALADAQARRGVDRAILDLRKATVDPPLSYTQLYELARAFQQAGFGQKQRLALLVPPNKYDKAEFFAICASSPTWNCYPFDTFEEAMEWLTETIELPTP